jgi:hypothetical protein
MSTELSKELWTFNYHILVPPKSLSESIQLACFLLCTFSDNLGFTDRQAGVTCEA